MALRVGQIIQGARARYRLLRPLKANTVFEAQVLQSNDLNKDRAVVKTAVGEVDRAVLKREYNNYIVPDIGSSLYVRSMYEAIGRFEDNSPEQQRNSITQNPLYLVFEWMDTDLRSVLPHNFRSDSDLPRLVSKSVLSALDLFKEYRTTHTDININNILLSNVDGPSPEVKVGDLGMLIREGYDRKRLQSLPSRAPEVWQGLGVCHASDIWSLGVALAHWISGRMIFGASDKRIDGFTEAWCIAKLMRLVGPLGPPNDVRQYQEEFELAEQLESMEMDEEGGGGMLITIQPLRQELERVLDPPVSSDLLDFIDYLLVVDKDKRPTARDALQHPYIQFQ